MDYMSYIRAIRSSDLTSPQKITAIMIASHYDFSKGDPAYPTNRTLSKETGLAVSTVVKAKKVLIYRGYLCSQIRYDNSSLYVPMLPSIITHATKENLNTHINTHINTQVNIKEKGFNKPLNSLETLNPDPLEYKKELTPAQADEMLSW